jgi:hypothetical protein
VADYGVENIGGAEISVLPSTRYTLDMQPDRLLELQMLMRSACVATGTTINYKRYCETLGKAKPELRSVSQPLDTPTLSLYMTTLDGKQVRQQGEGFDAPWFHRHGSPVM